MVYPDTFAGFCVHSAEKWSSFKREEFKPKEFGAQDIDIKITHCGACGSDIHTLRSGWGEVDYPICVGHEIVGYAVKVGKDVQTIKVGDLVGVGAQILSCLECRACKTDNENYCLHWVDTYGSKYPDGTKTMGGYASHIRAHERFTFPIPDGLDPAMAAPMLCAGLTVYSALVRNGAGPSVRVGVLGIGGLGHFALLFAKALGCEEIWALTHSSHKETDLMEMGATRFILMQGEDWYKGLEMSLDLIISTNNNDSNFPVQQYFKLLDVNGKLISVGLPEGPIPPLKAHDMIQNGCSISSSHIGSKKECLEMLNLAVRANVKSWIQEVQIGEVECGKTVEKLYKGEARYRYVFTGYDKVFADS